MAQRTRDRMIRSAALLMRERGARATSIDDVLRHSEAPRGSVYHHFPGGRDQLIREATRFAGEVVARRLTTFDAFLDDYRATLVESGFSSGCPVMAVAVEEGGAQPEAGAVFRRWADTLAAALVKEGIPEARADSLAVLAIAAVEGALALCRAQREIAPFDCVSAELRTLLDRERSSP